MTTLLPVERKMREAKFKLPKDAPQDWVSYKRGLRDCRNPPPCMKCSLDIWAFCAETEYVCDKYKVYLTDRRAEKNIQGEEEEE
jgi:hypothetical protein